MLVRIVLLSCVLYAASSQNSGIYVHSHTGGLCTNAAGPATGPLPADTCTGTNSKSKYHCIGGTTYISQYASTDTTCANAIETLIKYPSGGCINGNSFSCNGTTAGVTEASLLGSRNWQKLQFYTSNTCTTGVSFTLWNWLNSTCQVNNMGSFGTTSSKSFCTNGVAGSASYGDATCGTMKQFFSYNPNGCQQVQVSGGVTYYGQQTCSGSVPAPSSGLGNAATFELYVTAGCAGSYLATGAVTVDACLNEGGGNYSSVTCGGTSSSIFSIYGSNTCTSSLKEFHTWASGSCNPLPGSTGSYLKPQTCGTSFNPLNPTGTSAGYSTQPLSLQLAVITLMSIVWHLF